MKKGWGGKRVGVGKTNGRENEERGLWEFVSTTLLSFKQLQYQQGKGDIRGNSSVVGVCSLQYVCGKECECLSLNVCVRFIP